MIIPLERRSVLEDLMKKLSQHHEINADQRELTFTIVNFLLRLPELPKMTDEVLQKTLALSHIVMLLDMHVEALDLQTWASSIYLRLII